MALRRIFQIHEMRKFDCIRKFRTQSIHFKDRKDESTEIFSRQGDEGLSQTISGDVFSKDNEVFNAIGATEELLSYIGLAREYGHQSEQQYTDKLKRIQTTVIDISTAISRSPLNKITIPQTYKKELEDWIQDYSKQLPPPEEYIIPGGGVASASLHVARAICRRTERAVVPLVHKGSLDKEVIAYLNRLSDFLLMVSRIAAKHDNRAESIYIPKPNEEVQPQ
nr:unnamed protein product [Callosobruchus chinensis]